MSGLKGRTKVTQQVMDTARVLSNTKGITHSQICNDILHISAATYSRMRASNYDMAVYKANNAIMTANLRAKYGKPKVAKEIGAVTEEEKETKGGSSNDTVLITRLMDTLVSIEKSVKSLEITVTGLLELEDRKYNERKEHYKNRGFFTRN